MKKNKKIFLCPFNVELIITMHREKIGKNMLMKSQKNTLLFENARREIVVWYISPSTPARLGHKFGQFCASIISIAN